MAAQEQALTTSSIWKVIDKGKINGMCRMCGERERERERKRYLILFLSVKRWYRKSVTTGNMIGWH